MRLLFVTYRFPVYLGDAPSNTVFNLVKHFSRNHEVYLAGLTAKPVSVAALERVTQYCRRAEYVYWPQWRGALSAVRGLSSSEPLQMWYYRSRALASLVKRIIAEEQIELAYAYHLRAGQFVVDLAEIPRVIAIQPVQALHFGRRSQHTNNPILRLAYGMESRRLIGYEAEYARRFDSCLLISEKDRQAIDPEKRLSNIYFNPHGTDVDAFAPSADTVREKDTIVFSGTMSMDTNSDAAHYFRRDILPIVWAKRPQTRFLIVGKNPGRSLLRLTQDTRITVTGTVPDLRKYLWKSSVGVDPVRMAAGMQNKLIEGMAAGLPMVITPEANEGIQAPEGRAVLIGRTPEEFAGHVLALLEDDSMARAIASEAMEFVQGNWSWKHHFDCLESELQSLVYDQTLASTA